MAKLKKIYHKVKYKGRKNPTLNSDGLEGPASNRGLNLIYGKHAVLSALANPQRQINRLLLTLKSYDSLLGKIEQALCDGGHSKIKILPKIKMVRMVNRNLFYEMDLQFCDPKGQFLAKTDF